MKELEKMLYDKLIEENNSKNPYISNDFTCLDKTNLIAIEENMNNSSIKPLSHSGFIGAIKTFFKKVIRKLIKFYIEPFATQQTQFNFATYKELDRNAKENLILSNKIKYLENESLMNKIESENNNEKTDLLINTMNNISRKYDELNNNVMLLNKENTFLKDELVKYSSSLASRNLFAQSFDPELYKVSYSQCGEDSIIKYVLFSLGKTNDISYLDIGANHAKEISNTFGLYEAGASGVLVEANPHLITELDLYRNRDIIINKCISTSDDEEVDFYVINGDGLSSGDYDGVNKALSVNKNLFVKEILKVQTISVNTIIKNYFNNKTPDVVSIDIEGNELEILQQIDFDTFRPLIYVVESIPYKNELVIDDKSESIVKFMNEKDYTEYAFTGVNSIFVDKRQIGAQK